MTAVTKHRDSSINDKDAIWAAALEVLQEIISPSKYKSTFSRIMPVELTKDNEYILGVPNKFNQIWVERQYLELTTKVIRDITGKDITVSIIVDSSLADEMLSSTNMSVQEIIPEKRIEISTSDDNGFDPKYTFDSFVIGDTNHFARNAALAVAESPGLKYNPLFIWGGPGLGKTHLLQAIGTYVQENYPQKKVVYVTSEEFTNQFIISTQKNTTEAFRKTYRTTDLLLIDDIQFLEKKTATVEQFFHTFNYLRERGKQVVIASDRSPSEIDMNERITSRFNSGLQVDIQPPIYEVRLAILRQYTQSMSIAFQPEALSFMAEKSSGNIREMEGAITRVAAFAELSHAEFIDLELVKNATMDYFKDQIERPISIASIQKEVCRYYGITHAELIGSKRKQDIVFPRHVAMYLSQELTDTSLPKIGASFGGKDHTTVMHAAAKIKKMMSSQAEVYSQIQHLTNALRHKAI